MLRRKFSNPDITGTLKEEVDRGRPSPGPAHLAQRGRAGKDAAPVAVAYPVPVDWMRKGDRSLLSNATSLLVCGLLAGVVVAAAGFPIVAMSGLVAKAGADSFDKLPSALTVQQSPQITYVYASDGKTLLSTFYDENRLDVKLSDV